ncbi:hypothetical protein KSP40_PGU004982 [Platanthera guangdongensis]|uniref:Uncharacterized protein n=1 Tax=Platanthera guangdongensis TaxID=2320717 RepID=A0ABR2M3V3_9ASPA
MEVTDSIDDIPIQDPPNEEFSASNLTWTKFGNSEFHVVEVALIPYDRVEAFICGESSNAECPTRFHIARSRKRVWDGLKDTCKSDEYLQLRLPALALIIYHEKRHVNKSGFVCHGPLDRDAIGPRAKRVPYMCSEIQQQTMSLIYLGVPEENVPKTHLEGIQRYCGSDARIDSFASQYVQKLGMIVKRSTHELDLDDQTSIRMWVERNKNSPSFTFQILYSYCVDLLLLYPLYTLLAFDSRHHALPVAWVITRTITKQDVSKWMKTLVDRIYSVDSTWKIIGSISTQGRPKEHLSAQLAALTLGYCLR